MRGQSSCLLAEARDNGWSQALTPRYRRFGETGRQAALSKASDPSQQYQGERRVHRLRVGVGVLQGTLGVEVFSCQERQRSLLRRQLHDAIRTLSRTTHGAWVRSLPWSQWVEGRCYQLLLRLRQ